MPGKIKVKVLAGRNLPVMDRASDTTDAFVEIKFGGVTHKTDVCRKSLNPHWNSTEWYRFEVDESELQDEPLQLRLMDHDTYSANDAIGKVVISLAPLLAREANNAKGGVVPPGGAVMSGWIPVFDTMHGIRGELNVIVKVELFSDFNKYKTSSCGVQFFHCPMIPPGYRATAIHGFVEELVVNDDPEYQWIDKIRTPRASNEARQVAFIKLSNQVQRLVGLKAAELGANAVVGYQQDFDLEGEAGVVARAIGTAVSIAPLPMPSQLINIPPCTQQQLKKYLDILATDDENVTDLNQYYQTHQDELQKMLIILNPKTPSLLDETDAIDEEDKSPDVTRNSSITSYTGSILYPDDYASQKSLRHLSEDQIDLNKLLNRKDDEDSDSSGPLQKIKKLKTNFFTKKFSKRSRKSDQQEDQISLKSNSSDASRLSIDIRNEFKKLKRLKKPKLKKVFTNKEDEGVGMASILARSVIHAHTSLACIAETQDSEHSPGSTLRRTSESEPTFNMSDDDQAREVSTERPTEKTDSEKRKTPEIHFTSLDNIKSDETAAGGFERVRKISESCPTSPIVTRSDNLLKLPGDVGYYDSVSSALSGDSSEIYSSSSSRDEDDESSDVRTDTEKSYETTSSLVQSVLRHNTDHALIAEMDKKLSVLDNVHSEITEDIKHVDNQVTEEIIEGEEQVMDKEDNKIIENIIKNDEPASTATVEPDTCVVKSNSHYIKIHNPFAHKKPSTSISAPSSPVEKHSFVYRSSKRIKLHLSKLSKNNMIKSLSHYSLLPKKKHETKNMSRPCSSSEIPSITPSDTVLGSPFLSYADLFSLDSKRIDDNLALHKSDDIGRPKVSMYIGSEPASRASFSGPLFPYHSDHSHDHKKPVLKPTGLVHTAMETILIDKVQSLLLPTSPEPDTAKNKQFFNDVSEKLEKVEEGRSKCERATSSTNISKEYSSGSDTGSLQMKPHFMAFDKPTQKTERKESSGLVHTAVETILFDKVQSIMGPSTPELNKESNSKHEESYHKQKDKDSTGRGSVGSVKTIILDKVHSLLGPKTPDHEHKEKHFDSQSNRSRSNRSSLSDDHKAPGLVHTAMQTILMDKVQSLMGPNTPEPEMMSIFDEEPHERSKHQIGNNQESTGLVHAAMKTILYDNVQSMLGPKTPEPKIDSLLNKQCEEKAEEQESSGLIDTAIDTISIDKAQSLLVFKVPETDIAETNVVGNEGIQIKNTGNTAVTTGLVNTKMELNTTLIDKEQLLISTAPESKKTEVEDKGPNETKTKSTVRIVGEIPKVINDKKLIRQDSVHSTTEAEEELSKMSKEANVVTPCKATKKPPVLQHFHPILSGAPLETIPSLPESSLDHTESLDTDGVDDTNMASVCDNSHAACRFDRSEREKEREKDKGSPRHSRHESYGGRDPVGSHVQNSSLNASSTPMGIHRRSSDSDLSVTPKGGSLNTSVVNVGSGGGAILKPSMNSNNLDMLEYPFLTMTECPPGFIVHIGGTVCARSVKLVDGGGGESAARAAWWAELRTELRAHARALRCNAVLAYHDTAAICEDVCVLSASGTAVVINLDCDFNADVDLTAASSVSRPPIEEAEPEWCSLGHVPYSPGAGPYRAELAPCGGCRRARVPTVMLATCAKPNRLQSYAKAITLTAVASRVRRAPPSGEPGARDISDQLPFLEYELHKLLLAKLRMQGANSLFSLQTQIAIGERCVMALASGTAYKLVALPPPNPPRIKASENDKNALEIQKALWDAFNANRIANGYDVGVDHAPHVLAPLEDEAPALDLCADRDACVLELDEAEDVETARALASRVEHMPVFTSGLNPVIGAPPYAFTQVWRGRVGAGGGACARHVARALQAVRYKLRRLRPAALLAPAFSIELPDDEIQLVVSGAAIQLQDPAKVDANGADSGNHGNRSHHGNGTGDADDDIFTLDEEQLVKTQSEPVEEKCGQVPTTVSLTSLSYVSGARLVRRVCALRLLFVRETTAVRELGGLSGFLHTFTCEVLAIARAYTAALGGNALTSFYITQLMLQDNAHKNQGQCLLSVGGDVIHITY